MVAMLLLSSLKLQICSAWQDASTLFLNINDPGSLQFLGFFGYLKLMQILNIDLK